MNEGNGNSLLAVCTGCDIGNSLDTGLLVQNLGQERAGLICMEHPALCSEAGILSLHQQVEKNRVGLVAYSCLLTQGKG